MVSVVLLGAGNVSFHLANAFINSDNVVLKQVYARKIASLSFLEECVAVTDNIESLKEADVYVIAVSDNAIAKVASKITNKKAFVVHTSGATSISVLDSFERSGVFYMLQSFSKCKKLSFEEVPFCLEAKNLADYTILNELASSIGRTIYPIDSVQRKYLHVSAVFVNNFVNHLYKIGNDICVDNNIPFEVLLPLIKETAVKVTETSPKEAQTGPAVRKDTGTIKKHLELLNDVQKSIYNKLTKSIENEY